MTEGGISVTLAFKVNRRTLALSLLAPFLILSSSWAASGGARRVEKLGKQGRWFDAGELAQELQKASPRDERLRKAVEALEEGVRRDAENLDFDPKKYFYAQAYLDYFKRRRYADAAEGLEQVLIFELENEEVLRFLDKAQARSPKIEPATEPPLAEPPAAAPVIEARAVSLPPAARSLRLRPAATPALKPAPAASVAARPRPKAPVDPEALESSYRAALKAYVQRDLSQARSILSELLDSDPQNERFKRALQRIGKELP